MRYESRGYVYSVCVTSHVQPKWGVSYQVLYENPSKGADAHHEVRYIRKMSYRLICEPQRDGPSFVLLACQHAEIEF